MNQIAVSPRVAAARKRVADHRAQLEQEFEVCAQAINSLPNRFKVADLVVAVQQLDPAMTEYRVVATLYEEFSPRQVVVDTAGFVEKRIS